MSRVGFSSSEPHAAAEAAETTTAAAVLPIRSTDKTILANKGYLCKQTVGSGSYSKVKVAIRIRSSSATEKYAFKIIDRSKAPKDFQQKFLPRELEIWPQLKHPNIIRMYSYFEHEPKIYMMLEYAENGDVLDHVQKNGALKQRQARTWIKVCPTTNDNKNYNKNKNGILSLKSGQVPHTSVSLLCITFSKFWTRSATCTD